MRLQKMGALPTPIAGQDTHGADKAPIRSLTLGPAMPGNVSNQSTGQRQGNSKSQSQHESDWADVQEHSRLSVPAIAPSAHALPHTVAP